MHRSHFHYDLPKGLIAQAPLAERTASRLLVLGRRGAAHRGFPDLVDLLCPGDVLVVNDSRVVKARLFGSKDSGRGAEILVERIDSEREALKPGRALRVDGKPLSVMARHGPFYRLRFPGSVAAFVETHGHVPLPPYVERPTDSADETRYQTIYADRPDAVAAPTAGLHFDQALLRSTRRM